MEPGLLSCNHITTQLPSSTTTSPDQASRPALQGRLKGPRENFPSVWPPLSSHSLDNSSTLSHRSCQPREGRLPTTSREDKDFLRSYALHSLVLGPGGEYEEIQRTKTDPALKAIIIQGGSYPVGTNNNGNSNGPARPFVSGALLSSAAGSLLLSRPFWVCDDNPSELF